MADPVFVPESAPLRCFPNTDLGNAERLVARHGRDLRFCPARGWLVWDGSRWRDDDAGEVIQRMAGTVRALHAEAQTVENDDERRAMVKHALASEREGRIRAAVSLAATDPELVVRHVDLDADADLLNVLNGTVHLPSGELLSHDRAHHLTKMAPVRFESEAEAPTWEAFLDRVTDGRAELAEFLQRAIGYTLSGRPHEHVAIFLYGTGANGKSTLLEVLRDLLGEYAQQTPASTFLERRDGIPSDVARLDGARLVSAVEMPDGRRLNETLVKRLTGGDTITARYLHREWFEFRPLFTPWIATNHRPVIRGTEHAIWRRIRFVPFDVEIPPDERDPELVEKLRQELPGILRWALGGYRAYVAEGLEPPDPVVQATEGYRAEMDIVGAFLEERCVLREDLRANPTELYKAFIEHAGREASMSQMAFLAELQRRGFEKGRNGRQRWYSGLGLLVDDPTLLDGDELAARRVTTGLPHG